MENLVISFNSVMPMFVLILVGLLCRRLEIITENMVSKLNSLTFKVFTSVLLFSNIAHADSETEISVKLCVFIIASLLILYGLIFLITVTVVKDNKRRGAMIQGMFRSNYVLLGLPIVKSIFQDGNIAITSIVAIYLVPLYNILAVFTLETFRGGKVEGKAILKSIAKNPLIIGTLLGLAFFLLEIKLPVFLDTAVLNIASCATPLALIALGASFKFTSFKTNIKYSLSSTAVKLIALPAIMLPTAVMLGFRGVELATIMAVAASPSAIASFTMAEQMGSDSQLAGEIVVLTSALSCVTLFLCTFILKQSGFM